MSAGPIGRAVLGVGVRPFAYWDCGFKSHRGHGRLSVVSVVFSQVEVSVTSWSLVQRSPTDCDTCVWSRNLTNDWQWPALGRSATGKKKIPCRDPLRMGINVVETCKRYIEYIRDSKMFISSCWLHHHIDSAPYMVMDYFKTCSGHRTISKRCSYRS